jgi:hypothetical protein
MIERIGCGGLAKLCSETVWVEHHGVAGKLTHEERVQPLKVPF